MKSKVGNKGWLTSFELKCVMSHFISQPPEAAEGQSRLSALPGGVECLSRGAARHFTCQNKKLARALGLGGLQDVVLADADRRAC